jgi:uncharacterized protein
MASTNRPRLGLPDLGVGVGLRPIHYEAIFASFPPIDWFEIISENFMVRGGKPLANLDRILARYPVVQHGVSLSIGSMAPLDWDYLRELKKLLHRVRCPWVSDHLCFTNIGGVNSHELLPLPYSEEALRHVASRVRTVQDFLEVPLVLENASTYLTHTSSTMTEWAFLSAIVEEANCGILLDVNNIYVSSYNHGFDPREYVAAVPAHRVIQIHLAGHTNYGKYIIDTHKGHVIDPVWDLYRQAIRHVGSVSTLIEWDTDIPPLETLLAEAELARKIRDEEVAAREA